MFEEYDRQARIYCYQIDLEDYQTADCGKTRLVAGRARVTSEITRESYLMSFGVIHFGDHNLNAGVRQYQGEAEYQNMVQEITQTCSVADFPETIRSLDKHFGTSTYSLKSIFRDEQRKVMVRILESALKEIEVAYRQLYETHYPPMRFLSDLGNPVPQAFRSAAEFILNSDLSRAFQSDTLDTESVRHLLDEAMTWHIELDNEGLGYMLQKALGKIMTGLVSIPEDTALLKNVLASVKLARSTPFEVDLWKVQNLYYGMLQTIYPALKQKAQQGDKAAREWLTLFSSLGKQLSIRSS
jgi:hypothetical protein